MQAFAEQLYKERLSGHVGTRVYYGRTVEVYMVELYEQVGCPNGASEIATQCSGALITAADVGIDATGACTVGATTVLL
jgi:hypothetical protein